MKTEGTLSAFYHYAFPTQAVLVTCNDTQRSTNIITIAWHTTISHNPPLYGISVHPKRYSYELICTSKEFIVNFVPYSLAKTAHYCGTHSGRTTNKSQAPGSTLIPATHVHTSFIKEGYAHLECILKQTVPLGDHALLIGEVVATTINDAVFKDNLLRTEKIHPLYYIGDNSYTTLNSKTKKHF